MEAIFDKMEGSRCTRLAVVEFDSMGARRDVTLSCPLPRCQVLVEQVFAEVYVRSQ